MKFPFGSDVEAMALCPTCGYLCPMPDFINNFGICNNCWDDLEMQHKYANVVPIRKDTG